VKAEFLGWLQVVQGVMWIVLAIYTWYSKQQSARTSQVRALEVANELQERKLLLLEQRVQAMPCDAQCGAFRQLSSDVAVLKERTEHLDDWLTRMSDMVDRIDNYLRENR